MSTPPVPSVHPRRHRVFFPIAAVLVVLLMAASSAPSPLYVVYQRLWGFTPAALTVIFAIYVLGMLAALLVVGRLSDHLGRRPVLLVAVAVEAAAMVLFLVAGDAVVLGIARVVQGVATGAAISVLGASLVDLVHPEARHHAGAVNSIAPTIGLAVGALGSGALVQFAPAPTRLVYVILLAGFVLAALAVVLMPETAIRRPGALGSLVPRAGLPAHLRPRLAPVIPVLVAGWALGGLYMSLGPSIAVEVFGSTNHLVGGMVLALLCAAAAVASFVLRPVDASRIVVPAAAAVAVGAVVTLLGIAGTQVVLALVGTVVTGIGFGAASVAMFGTVARFARPEERSAVIAVVYVISYLAFSVPAVVAGIATGSVGLRPTAEGYTLLAVVLAVVALVLGLRALRRGSRTAPAVGA